MIETGEPDRRQKSVPRNNLKVVVALSYSREIIFWFESDVLVVALVGFNKAKLGDVWYTSAAIRGEALVDQWRRTHQPGTEGTA